MYLHDFLFDFEKFTHESTLLCEISRLHILSQPETCSGYVQPVSGLQGAGCHSFANQMLHHIQEMFKFGPLWCKVPRLVMYLVSEGLLQLTCCDVAVPGFDAAGHGGRGPPAGMDDPTDEFLLRPSTPEAS